MKVIKCPKCKTERMVNDRDNFFRCPSCQTRFDNKGKIIKDDDKSIVTCPKCGATFDKTIDTFFRKKGFCFCGTKV